MGKLRWSQSQGTVGHDCQGTHHCKDRESPLPHNPAQKLRAGKALAGPGPSPHPRVHAGRGAVSAPGLGTAVISSTRPRPWPGSGAPRHPRPMVTPGTSSPAGQPYPGLVPPTHQVGTEPQAAALRAPSGKSSRGCSLAALCSSMLASEGRKAATTQALPPQHPTSHPKESSRLWSHSAPLAPASGRWGWGVLPLPCPWPCCLCAGRGPLARAECCLSRHWIPRRGWGPHRRALPPPPRSLPRRSLCALRDQRQHLQGPWGW